MPFKGLHRTDFTIHGIGGVNDFGLRWHRLLFPIDSITAVHPAPSADGFQEWTPVVPVDQGLPAPGDLGSADPGQNPPDQMPVEAVPDPAGEALGAVRLPPTLALTVPTDPPAEPPLAPDDPEPPAGLLPKPEAVIWSGPAVVPAPGGPQDGAGAPLTTGAADPVSHGDLGSVFLAPGQSDLTHGPDLGLSFTPPPLPPPPDFI